MRRETLLRVLVEEKLKGSCDREKATTPGHGKQSGLCGKHLEIGKDSSVVALPSVHFVNDGEF